jgi:nitrite reductase/ring-hydroxylating ferredoxin subunit
MPSLEFVWSSMHIVAAAAGALVIGAAFFLLSRSKSASAKSDLIRAVVGKSSDFKEGEPRAVKIEGAKNPILVVRHGGQLHAVGNKCPHAGAALNTGVFSCGRIVCPLHGASFDITTGEIEDAGPCLNQVRVGTLPAHRFCACLQPHVLLCHTFVFSCQRLKLP